VTPFSDFYSTLRTLLGDNDSYSNFEYQNGALDGAVRSVFLLGRGPDNYALNGDRQSTTDINPEIPSGDPFALIAYEAGLLLIGGSDGAFSYKTRGLSVHRSGDKPKTLLAELRVKIYAIRAGTAQFVSIQSFVSWVNSLRNVQDAVLEGTPAPLVPVLKQINIGLY
jgi:hypothetical protein